jgi:hypothetical protein
MFPKLGNDEKSFVISLNSNNKAINRFEIWLIIKIKKNSLINLRILKKMLQKSIVRINVMRVMNVNLIESMSFICMTRILLMIL